MANWFSVFQKDPKSMPGQGLASPDYNYDNTKNQYSQLNKLYAGALDAYLPRVNASRLKGFDTLVNGTADTPGVSRLYMDSLRAADPTSARLLDTLSEDAENELALGNQLDPAQRRMIEQSTRAGSAARGLGYGPSDVWAESFAKTGYGDQLRKERRGNALTLAQLRQAMASQPLDMAIRSTLSLSPEQNMFDSLQNVYGQNQANARTKADLETKIGMHQADVWNGWFKTAAAAI